MRAAILVAIVALALLLSYVGARTIWAYGIEASNGADWLSYRDGARRLIDTGSPYAELQSQPYRLNEMAWGAGFVYPPPAAIFMVVTLAGDWTLYFLNATGLLAFVGVAVQIGRKDQLAWPWIMLVAAVAIAHPGFREMREGQLSPLVAAAVGAMWLGNAGWWSVLAGAVKVYPGLGVLWALRRGESIRGPLIVGACLVAFTCWLWPAWIVTMIHAQPGCPSWSLVSLSCLTGTRWVGYAVAGLFVVIAWRLRQDRLAFFALTLAMIAPAPDLYWGYLMVPFIGLLPTFSAALARLPAFHEFWQSPFTRLNRR